MVETKLDTKTCLTSAICWTTPIEEWTQQKHQRYLETPLCYSDPHHFYSQQINSAVHSRPQVHFIQLELIYAVEQILRYASSAKKVDLFYIQFIIYVSICI